MTVEIRRGTHRFVDREAGRQTLHAFAFGDHYDADRLDFGPMVCHDDHLLGSGRGFDEHPHSGLEIVSWVVSGTLVHAETPDITAETPDITEVATGSWAWLSTGPGIRHSEHASPDGPVRFIQVWLRAEPGAAPAYRTGTGPLTVATSTGAATFTPMRIGPGETVTLPAAARVHAFVATGALLRSSLAEPLHAGDAFLLTDEPAYEIAAGVPTDVLVWTFAS